MQVIKSATYITYLGKYFRKDKIYKIKLQIFSTIKKDKDIFLNCNDNLQMKENR